MTNSRWSDYGLGCQRGEGHCNGNIGKKSPAIYVIGDAKYSVLDAAIIYHVTIQDQYSILDGATIFHVINHVTGDANYSVLYAAALYHVKSYVTGDVKYSIFHAQSYTIGNFTDDAKYSVSKGATIPCHYPYHWCFQMLVGAIICHFTETERYSVGEREQGGKTQLSSKQINLIDDVWDDW